MERFGFVGLPNAGKSSLFNALSGGDALAAAYPFATVEPNVGVARVPDERLDRLAAMSSSARTVHATVEFVDIGGLVEGASKGEGLGNRFLAGIREVDAVVLVLRAFRDDDVVGPAEPLEHLAVVETELALADLATVEARVERTRKAARADRSLAPQVDALDAALTVLAEGTPLYRSHLGAEQREALRPFFLLTNKPVLVVVNIGEDDVEKAELLAAPVAEAFAGATSPVEVVPVSVQLEAETSQLAAEERAELLEGLGLGEGALPRLVRTAYSLLGRRTFLTTGDKESRAWTFQAGARAPECAGVIHTDFQRGFIKAECIRWDELLGFGSWAKAKDAGKVRIEGKDYEVLDGDVLEFRFNV
ncbi:redox-regulated ATPase YchF [soil metagenome]